MRIWLAGLVLLLAGCAAAVAPPPAPAGAAAAAPPTAGQGLPFVPLLIDRTDLRLGTTVQFSRIPTAEELNDLLYEPGLARVLLALPAWPADYAALQPLEQTPQGIEVVVVLPGYAPSRAAANAWNYLHVALRIVVVVDGPPSSVVQIDDLNALRGLERVIARMDTPSRRGFDRLQRPLSFWKVVP